MPQPTIFITGVTGFLGGATLARLLSHPLEPRVLLLIRAPDRATALMKALKSVARFRNDLTMESFLARVDVLPGSLFEMADLPSHQLDGITHVLHLAANTSFSSRVAVRETNILGALAIAHRARRIRTLERYIHVGTAWCCGATPPRLVHEDNRLTLQTKHWVDYTASKAESELLLRATCHDMPLIVARPSIVVGHSELGCKPTASIFWTFRAVDLLKRICWSPSSRIDVVPVDFVADALILLTFARSLRHDTYHVSAGEGASATWEEIGRSFAKARGESLPTSPVYSFMDGPVTEWAPHMLASLGEGDSTRLCRALDLYFRFAAANTVFDNHRLLGEGIAPPASFPNYLERCVVLGPPRSIYDQMRDEG